MTKLTAKRCEPCQKGTAPLSAEEVTELRRQVPDWEIQDGKLERELKLKNFRAALDLVNEIGGLAEEEGHHPDISIYSWSRLRVVLYTHAIDGLSDNDFILAAKIDGLPGMPPVH